MRLPRARSLSLPSLVVLVCLLGITGITSGQWGFSTAPARDRAFPQKVIPAAVEGVFSKPDPANVGNDPWRLFDGTLTSALQAETVQPEPVLLTLDRARPMVGLRVFGGGGRLSVLAEEEGALRPLPGLDSLALASTGWRHFQATEARRVRALVLEWEPDTADARLPEVEILTRSRRGDAPLPGRPSSGTPALPYGVQTLQGFPVEQTVGPGGTGFTVSLGIPPGAVRRAFLLYEVEGLPTDRQVLRSVNGDPLRGGRLGSSHSLAAPAVDIEEILPSRLQRGENHIRFAAAEMTVPGMAVHGLLPSSAICVETGYRVRNLRLAILVDEGGVLVSDPTWIPAPRGTASALVDGSVTAPWRGTMAELPLERAALPHTLEFAVGDRAAGTLTVETLDPEGTPWSALAPVALDGLGVGWHRFLLPPRKGGSAAAVAATLRLAWTPPPGDATARADLREVNLLASPPPAAPELPRLILSPTQELGHGVQVRGSLTIPRDAQGPAQLFVDGLHVADALSPIDGALAFFLPAPADTEQLRKGWSANLEVIYPGGQRLRHTLRFGSGEEDLDGSRTLRRRVRPGEGGRLEHRGAHLEIPGEALQRETAITIRGLSVDEMPALNPGMTNVTAQQACFRFGPDGQKFEAPIRLSLPFDAAKIPEGMTPEDVRTFYFDVEAGRWIAVEREAVAMGEGLIHSRTDHFTDFINATLTVPDHPEGSAFAPNSITRLEGADPSAGITVIEPPDAHPGGSAQLTFPLILPPGRSGMAPSLMLTYDNDKGNDWLGLGWDLALPTVEVDTRFGVPRYASADSETYLLDGAQLRPAAGSAASDNPRVFVRRVEGRFERILRHGTAPHGFWWEVIEQSGLRYHYGRTAQSRLADPTAAGGAGNIFRWRLERMVDPHGNTVDLRYRRDSGATGEPWARLYPAEILYTGTEQAEGNDAYYRVRFHLDDGSRPDTFSSGRPGFKTYTRHRLDRVTVETPAERVRTYRLHYEVGAFSKSLLQAVSVAGSSPLDTDGEELYRHTFDYTRLGQDGDAAFTDPQSWGDMDAGQDASDITNLSGAGHAFAGLGGPGCALHVGVQGGIGGGTSDTETLFLDVNGDGLPDRLSGDGRVELNRLIRQGEPEEWRGDFDSTNFSGAQTLNHNDQLNFDLNVSAHALGDIGTVGGGLVWSHSTDNRIITDIDGDGLPDLVTTQGGFEVRRNTGSGFESGSCWSGYSLDGIDLEVEGQREELEEGFPRSDPLRSLFLPFDGEVTVSGAVRKAEEAGRDGVEVEIFQNGNRVWGRTIEADDTSPCTPASGNDCGDGLVLSVHAGDRLHFLADSRDETAGDDLLWAPRVVYNGLTAEEHARHEAHGAPVFRFDAEADFRLAGQGPTSWTVAIPGLVRVVGTLDKRPTATDVVAEIYRARGNLRQLLWQRTLGAAEETLVEPALEVDLQAEERLTFHLRGETPFDPDRIRWVPVVTYDGGEVCLADAEGNLQCGAVTCDGSLGGEGECTVGGDLPVASLPREDLESSVLPQSEPLVLEPRSRPTSVWYAPGDGDYEVALGWARSGPLAGTAAARPAVLLVQSSHRLLARTVVAADQHTDGLLATVTLAEGEPLIFTSVAVDGAQRGTLGATVNGVAVAAVARFQPSVPLDPRIPYLAGGYHGWFVGDWNGEGSFSEGRLEFDEGDDDTAVVTPQPGNVESETGAEAAWLGSGFDFYLTAQGVKPSRRGGDLATELDRANGGSAASADLQAGGSCGGGVSMLRKTYGRTAGLSAGLVAGFSFSDGFAETQVDLLDLNGDQYPDQISGGGVRFSDGQGGFGRLETIERLGDTVRRIEDANIASSLGGLGTPAASRDGKGKSRSVRFTMPSVAATTSVSRTETQLVDVNGDGLPDRVSLEPDAQQMKVRLNLGYRFGAEESWPLPQWRADGGHRCREDTDFLNDLILDRVVDKDTPNSLAWNRSAAANVGVALGIFGAGVGTTLSRDLVEFLDVNGDGLADHVYKEHGDAYFRVKLNRGDHWGPEERWSAASWEAAGISIGDGYNPAGLFQCLDSLSFQGDVSVDGSAGVPICIPLIPPAPVAGLQIEISAQVAAGNGGMQLFFEDVDGDGLPDHALKKAGDPTVYVRRNQAAKINLLKAVERPLGGSFTLDYARQGNRVEQAPDGRRIDMPTNQWALAEVVLADGRGNQYRTTFDYGNDSFFDRQERQDYGYRRILTTRPDGSTLESLFHNQDFYRRNLPTKTLLRDADGRLFTVQAQTYADPAGDPGLGLRTGSFFPALQEETTAFYEGQATTEGGTHKLRRSTSQYDALGNVIFQEDFGDAADPDDNLTARITYHQDLDAYIIRPATITVRDGDGRLLRQRSGTYDARGNLLRLEQTLGGGHDPETGSPYSGGDRATWRMTWDGDGGLVSITDPLGFALHYEYDRETRTHVTATRDSFGYTSAATYDLRYGLPVETTDKNGSPMRRVYDAFGRLVEVFAPQDLESLTGPGGTPSLAMEYFPTASPSYAVVHHKDVTRPDPIDTVVFLDGLGRTLQTRRDIEIDSSTGTGGGTRIGFAVSGRVQFDALGRVAAIGQPVFDGGALNRFLDGPLTHPTHFEYDVLDRRTRVRFPFQAETTVAYDLETLDGILRLRRRRTDPEGHTTATFQNLRGDVVAVEQTNTVRGARRKLLTRYVYNPLSELERVTDAAGHGTTVEYDTLGRRIVIDNPDLGRTEFRYDRGGNLGARITAELASHGERIRLHRTFHRLDRIEYPDTPDVLFTYGAPGAPFHRADRVVTVNNEAGTEEFFYGPLGEVERTIRTAAALNGNSPKGPYATSYRYDSFHRLLGVTYPDDEVLSYTFDAGGRVRSVTGVLRGETYRYITHQGYDEFGSVVRTVFGNGVETRRTYDPRSRFQIGLDSVAPSGREFQDLRLTHDRTGSVLSIRNEVPLPKPSEFGGPTEQTFQYDELYQLVAAEGSYRFPPNKRSDYRLTMSYDETGNILTKRQVHEIVQPGGSAIEQKKTSYGWSYAYSGPQPHAVTHLGERTFHYDRNGNQTGWDHDQNGTRRRMTWDEENRLKAVADNGQTTHFLYDWSGTRTNKAGPHSETIYVNPYFSVRSGNIASKHVWVDGRRIVTKIGRPALGNPAVSAPLPMGSSGGLGKPHKPGKPSPDPEPEPEPEPAPAPNPNPTEDQRYFFHPDHVGSTHFVTDAEGELYQHLEYFPFGEIWVDERAESQRTPYLFSGKELDEETGLAYFGARYYDPRISRWVSADPILENLLVPGALARPDLSPQPFRLPGYTYAYVGNDPVNLVDPNGLMKRSGASMGSKKTKASRRTEQNQPSAAPATSRRSRRSTVPEVENTGEAAEVKVTKGNGQKVTRFFFGDTEKKGRNKMKKKKIRNSEIFDARDAVDMEAVARADTAEAMQAVLDTVAKGMEGCRAAFCDVGAERSAFAVLADLHINHGIDLETAMNAVIDASAKVGRGSTTSNRFSRFSGLTALSVTTATTSKGEKE